jgi:predicted dehydrogenase
MSNSEVSVLFVSIGGYGHYYLKTIFEEFPPGKAKVCGVIDPYAEKAPLFPEVQKRGIPVFSNIEDFYNQGLTADLVVISSPIQYHVPQSIVALKNGSNVLCDKPICATVQEVDELIKVRDESGKWVMIGYQWSYSKAIQELKKDINSGLFGKPIRLKTLCLWPRDDAYYGRNNWAGKIKDARGKWVLDSPVNNALAHFLHNMFYVLGNEVDKSAIPKTVIAECYRANPIENYDTAICKIQTNDDVEIMFYVSHATNDQFGPIFEFEFENAKVSYGDPEDKIIAQFKDGTTKDYGAPDDTPQFHKLFVAVDRVKSPSTILCGLEAARSQTLVMNGVQDSVGEILNFPKTIINREADEKRWCVSDLFQNMIDAYQGNLMLHQTNVSWTQCGKTIELFNYFCFPGGAKL